MKKINLLKTFLVLLILVVIPLVHATFAPLALGVEGTVYYLDGKTELFEGVEVLIENLDTSQVAIATTGKGSPGRYSIALPWAKGDVINVSVRNPFYQDFVLLTLEGSMRNVNLYLDMDIPNVAPNITSTPLIEAFENQEYIYQIEAFDWNLDEIYYELLEAPENMSISSQGLITWTPTRDQHGLNNVSINVSDGIDDSYQSFQLEVFVETTPPNILSTPSSYAKKGEVYRYVMEVDDEDLDYLSYEIFRGAPGMYFEDNVLIYTPLEDDGGTYIIILDVRNRFNELSRQIYFLTIQEKEEQSLSQITRVSSSRAQEVFQRIKSNNLFNFTDTRISISQLQINSNKTFSITITKLDSGLSKIPLIQTRTYQFLEIKANEYITEEVNIRFNVKKSWLNSFNISNDEVVLVKYINKSWVELPTTMLSSNNDTYTFSAISQGLSLFAITHKKNASISNPEITSNTFVTIIDIGGLIKLENISSIFLNQITKRLRVELTNLNSKQSETGLIQLVNQNIFYHTKIIGNTNDLIRIKVYFNDKEVFFEEFVLRGVDLSKNLAINDDIIKSFINKRIYLYIIGVVILILVIIFITIKGRWLETKN